MEKRQPVLERSTARWDETQLQILDAAELLITQRGVGGLTIAELARTSGFSRPTVYRSWQGADDVVRAALLRRVLDLLSGFTPATTREELVADVLEFARRFRADAMYTALLEREPEVFTRYTLQRFGSSQLAILDWLAESITRAQEQGSVRSGDPAEIATMLLLITQSAILSHGTVSVLLDAAAWRRELRFALDGHLRP
ncbi:TetR/AcrR family transcriptional regulator [Microbacterium nymphoidis]|uniref:TetR/AcrR family transcriptional regulator n=1 Tax=Microbacterium nymphoidis TaxID=2898586 RepID=UPI001E29F088|nr:TetR/AcrR family transcriptional regulator [Microbacterium nymphoidis]MCD2497496.1 TetR/AcrR family transcriptional regulator [Microbacterium nymphoidis]